jgi:hypothetical protein
LGLPAQRFSKELIAYVRPGVLLVLAIFMPSRELITLDLPKFSGPGTQSPEASEQGSD